jgi:hypothetical protein
MAPRGLLVKQQKRRRLFALVGSANVAAFRVQSTQQRAAKQDSQQDAGTRITSLL